MKVGWNRRYVLHNLACRNWVSKSLKLLILTAALSSFIFAFPVPTEVILSSLQEQQIQMPVVQASFVPLPTLPKVATESIERMLAKYGVDSGLRQRVAHAIVASSRKYNVDSRLVASIMIVESRANPFAISDADAIGIMQIHLPTWGPVADKQGINLFKIEDNVDLGVRILKGYMAESGMWEGVARYNGSGADPVSQQATNDYVQKVQRIYGIEPSASTPIPEAASN